MKSLIVLKIQKLDLLISIYIFCMVASELMGAKTFPLLNLGPIKLNASVAIFIFPLIFTINDIITEVYGKEKTKSVIRSGFIVIGLTLIFSILFVKLPPSTRFTPLENSYDEVFGLSARISAASLIALMLSEISDVLIFVKIRKRFGKKKLWLRNNVSNIFSQLIDTLVFMTLAFYALNLPLKENFAFILGISLPYWLLKCFMSILETPFVYLGVRWLKDEKLSQ